MKLYSFLVATYIVLICFLSGGVCFLLMHRLWFSAIAVVLVLLLICLHLYHMQMRQMDMMDQFIGCVRFRDLSQRFPVVVKNKRMKGLAQRLSAALKQIQTQLVSEEIKRHYYENLLNKVDTAVLVADKKGQIEWMNREAIDLFEQSAFLPESLRRPVAAETQVIRLQKNGITKEMAVSITSFAAQEKEQWLISLKNIHAVLERNEMEAWQKLIRVLTHEIMNSITPIISVSETLNLRTPENMTPKDYSVMRQAMQTIHRRSSGLLSFVENYRRLTRLPVPQCTEVSVAALFTDLQKLFPNDYIVFETPPPTLCLFVDRAQIEQLLINLLKNAKEAVAGRQDPSVRISVYSCNKAPGPVDSKAYRNTVEIRVEDNGEGILPDVLNKIFVPFFTTKKNGSGIGLSLCKQIMTQHDGTIRVLSQPALGSCFILTFRRP
jgi:nitrogen fixation/metabolism regulation signal transduction histidine kinase